MNLARWLTIDCLLKVVGAWVCVSVSAVLAVVTAGGSAAQRATIGMGTCLALLWMVAGGSLMRAFRDRFKAWWATVTGPWQLKFVLLCTTMALLEEVITTTLTNLAPCFGVPVGAAYITASANYFDVVARHSVVVFVPMFITWSWLLGRYDFVPNRVFLCFGLTGALAEASSFGRITEAGFWIFVYGLMVYLPAHGLPPRAGLRPMRWWHWPMGVLLPFLSALPVAGIVMWLHPVKIHFPPIQ